jgi:hypothetical protein
VALDAWAFIREMSRTRSPVVSRVRRTKATFAWLVGMIGAVLVGAGLMHYVSGIGSSPTHQPPVSASRNPSAERPIPLGQINLGIAYGTTQEQMLRQLGSPTTKRANCWLYRGQIGTIRGRYSGPYVDALKFCFSDGPAGGKAVTQILSHRSAHSVAKTNLVTGAISKHRVAAFWGWPIDRTSVPDWYVQENS